jgi:c-di-GMP-binding flagellar brake protein YcgR
VEIDNQELLKAEFDKRKYRRAKLVTQVKCEAVGREDIAVTRDVSAGGMFLNDPNPFPKNSIVSLAFRLSPTDPLLSCQGEVVYSLKGVGMGIMFTQVSEEIRQALDKFVDQAN